MGRCQPGASSVLRDHAEPRRRLRLGLELRLGVELARRRGAVGRERERRRTEQREHEAAQRHQTAWSSSATADEFDVSRELAPVSRSVRERMQAII